MDDGWELVVPGGDPATVPATVPGCVHTDLLAAGLIPDPYLDRNEDDLHWIGGTDWTYRLVVSEPPAGPGEHVDLVFDGLDTLATVAWNGEVVATTANQHRRYRIPLGDRVTGGDDVLTITFAAPVTEAARRREAWGEMPNPYDQPYPYLRKMACNFGWDWGPRLTTAGIWRPVALERWTTARIAALWTSATLDATDTDTDTGVLSVGVDVDSHANSDVDRSLLVDVTVRGPGGGIVARAGGPVTERLTLTVPGVERWWPIGLGDQTRYDVEVTLLDEGGVVDRATRRIGFRSVELDTTPDDDGDGARFAFVVNGERVWVRGFNWIPDDCFPSRVTPERYRDRIDEAVAANANLLRVWGGGIYEDDAFYDHCDAVGVLVWQDFPFACAAYPEVELEDEIKAEAADNVERLHHHPSLLVWCGNNENLEGHLDWGWRDVLGDRPWGETIYRRWLPDLVARLDPDRPYLDGSPTSLDPDVHPLSPDRGTVHLWDVWNRLDHVHYRDHTPRFVAEFGFQAPATHATLRAAIDPAVTLAEDHPSMVHRQRAFEGREKLNRWLAASFGSAFGEVIDPDDWLYLTQLVQARAVEVGVGHFRSLHERCSGVIWWQLNDCWPAISWSVLDSAGRRKPSWYAARRILAERTVVLTPRPADAAQGAGLDAVLVNDSRTPWAPTLTVDVWTGGRHRNLSVEPGTVDAGDASTTPIPDGDLVVVTAGSLRVVAAGPDAPVERPRFEVSVEAGVDGGVVVEVAALSVVRDLCLFADRVDPHAVVDEMVVTVLPGERHRFVVSTTVAADRWSAAITAPRSVALRALGDRIPPM